METARTTMEGVTILNIIVDNSNVRRYWPLDPLGAMVTIEKPETCQHGLAWITTQRTYQELTRLILAEYHQLALSKRESAQHYNGVEPIIINYSSIQRYSRVDPAEQWQQ